MPEKGQEADTDVPWFARKGTSRWRGTGSRVSGAKSTDPARKHDEQRLGRLAMVRARTDQAQATCARTRRAEGAGREKPRLARRRRVCGLSSA